MLEDFEKYVEDLQKSRLPDGVGAIGSVRCGTVGDVRDKMPRPRNVCAGVEIDPGAVLAPAVASAENGARRVAGERRGEHLKRRLCVHAPAVDLVRKVRDILPMGTAILALEDGEVAGLDAAEGSRG